MNKYTLAELADMYLVYGAAQSCGRRTHIMYSVMYPRRQVPHQSTFAAIDQRLRDPGTVAIWKHDSRRGRHSLKRSSLPQQKRHYPPAPEPLPTQWMPTKVLQFGLFFFVTTSSLSPAAGPDDYPRLQFARRYLQQCNMQQCFSVI
ncbi:hypothetical protein PR048_010271 [Dryococelus australis]|uniref:DUF4817 domain-containing protein n=1 Tax=Dryococelus australis TaxID=614101 RepID=A0ABQ9I282_9NEOP|nr:hypothetical protein PR048_010271 [Dryococelus australis]